MNWGVLGAIAELIGALAVLITLIYLVCQTRDNVKAMRSKAVYAAPKMILERAGPSQDVAYTS